MCLVGAVLMAMGATPRVGDANFDPTDAEYAILDRIMTSLGFEGYLGAENYNDASGHEAVLARYDKGLQDWTRP